MTKLFASIAALALSVPAAASTWKSDPDHSAANFSATHMMMTTVHGTLGPITSTLDLDDKDITKSKVEASIDPSKLYSAVEKRDNHLRSKDFLDVAKYPAVTFKSKKVEKVGDKYKITGDLTIKDKTKEVVLDTAITPEITNPFNGAISRGVTASGVINREDWGLVWNVPVGDGLLVSKEVKIKLQVEFLKEGAKAAPPAKK